MVREVIARTWSELKPGRFYILHNPLEDENAPSPSNPFFLIGVKPSAVYSQFATISVLVGDRLKVFTIESVELNQFNLLEDANEAPSP